MSNLRPQVQAAIKNFIQSQDGHHIASDVLRVIEEEAAMMKETQDLHDMLDSDPMEQLGEAKRQVQRLKNLAKVTSCTRVRVGSDYSGIDAVVTMEKCQNLQLTFKYERKPRAQGVKGCHVWFSIELSKNYGQRETLLNVQVWAPAGVPSGEEAVCIQDALMAADGDDESDGWEDMEEEEERELAASAESSGPMVISDESQPDSPTSSPKVTKKQKTSNTPLNEDSATMDSADEHLDKKEDDDKEETNDSFVTFLDPDVLEKFLELAGLMPMNEGTAFFLLMTFPFYEQEWDIVGYVLDQVFGAGSDDDESDGD